MSWGMHEAAKKLASGWCSEFDMTREINADLGRENVKLRERVAELEELTNDKLYIPQEWYQLATIENARLRDENARLRSCLSDDADNARQIMGENAQLRELVRDLVRWNGAEHQPHEELQFWGDKSSGVYARMRALGVEVDE